MSDSLAPRERKRDKISSLLGRSPSSRRASSRSKSPAHSRPTLAQAEQSLQDREQGVYGIDESGGTELHKAARLEGRAGLKAVRALLKKGAEVQARDFEGRTPLHAAAEAGNWRVCLELVARGADVKALASDNSVPLNMMAKGRFEPSFYSLQAFVALLGPNAILMGHPVYKLDRRRETPLHQACARGRKWLVLAFLLNGADVNCSTEMGDTPLHYAIGTNNVDVVKLLLDNEADIYAKDKKGRSCVSLLREKERWSQVLADHLPEGDLRRDSSARSRRSMMLEADDSAVLSLALSVRSLLAGEQEQRATPALQDAAGKLDQLIHVLATRFSEEHEGKRQGSQLSLDGAGSPRGTDDDLSLSEDEGDEEASNVNLASLRSVQELVESEERLLTFLEQTQMVYIDKIEAASFLKDEDKQLLVSNFSLIYNTFASVSRKLADYLSAAKEDPKVSLAEVLRQLPTYLKYVKPYCRTFEEVNDKIQELMVTNPKFVRLQEEGMGLVGHKLEVLLIMPVQRVMRYPMMLEAVLDEVPGNHRDFAGINEVFADFKSLAIMIDEDQELSKRRRQVRDIAMEVGGIDFELVQAARVLLYQGTVEVAQKDDTTTARQLYLFNDLLLLARASDDLSGSGGKGKKKFQFALQAHYSLANAFVLLLPDLDPESIYEHAIQFCHQDKAGKAASFTIVARSRQVRDSLLEKLHEALATMNNKSGNQVSVIDKSESMFASIEGAMRVMKGAKVAKAYAKLQGNNLFLFRHKKAVKWTEKIALCDYSDVVPDLGRHSLLLRPVGDDSGDGCVKLVLGSSVEFTEWMIEVSKQLFSQSSRAHAGTVARRKA